jgi:hypothetical protein
MRLPALCRRSRRREGATTERSTGRPSGLAKWQALLTAEEATTLPFPPLTRRAPHEGESDRGPTRSGRRARGAVCSPRWLDDKAGPNIQRFRTGAQVYAIATARNVHPLLLA